ncbi:hypothetical protein DSECCO2_175050 [anaerobic digester metagenome]
MAALQLSVALLLVMAEVARPVGVDGGLVAAPPIKLNETVLAVALRAILVIGLPVFAPAQDFMLGVVASV